ncbi:MAG: ribosomal protein L13e [Candidatus Nitrosopolaris sp.]
MYVGKKEMKVRVDGPIIKHWKSGIELVRGGRGYSKAELYEVGLRDLRNARNHGIPVDPERKTKYPQNIEQLRVVAKTIIESSESKTKTKNLDSKKKRETKKKTDIKKKTSVTKNKKLTKQSSE